MDVPYDFQSADGNERWLVVHSRIRHLLEGDRILGKVRFSDTDSLRTWQFPKVEWRS